MKACPRFRFHSFGLMAIGAGLLVLPLLRAERHEFGNDSDVKAAILPTPPPIGGILYVVDSTDDGDLVGPSTQCDDGTGHCTLRAAITAANLHSGADGISFNLPAPSTINLTSALSPIFDPVTISGPGADKLTVRRDTGGTYRIFSITTTGIVSFSGLTIANGMADSGGGIQNVNAGTVNITNCLLSGNSAIHGGGISNNSTGTVNVANSTLHSNDAFPIGSGSASGGGIFNSGTVNVTNSTLSGNSAQVSDNSASGGGIFNSGTVNVTNSTLSGNDTGPLSGVPLSSLDASGGG